MRDTQPPTLGMFDLLPISLSIQWFSTQMQN
jgi:hypothetical protein